MFEAVKLADGEYLFFIGDDDFLFENGLRNIFSLIKGSIFDMAIFNAVLINEDENTTSELIGFSGKEYPRLEVSLPELKKFCSYGNILVKKIHSKR